MEVVEEVIHCENLNKTFNIAKFRFGIPEDQQIIGNFIEEGEALARRLNGTLARDSSRTRDFNTLKTNAIAGVVSEFVWRSYLNDFITRNKMGLSIQTVPLIDIRNQIDIIVIYPDESRKTIEVRSSFPYTGIKKWCMQSL